MGAIYERVYDFVFEISGTIKSVFVSGSNMAGNEDFRFHVCRYTVITRKIQLAILAPEVLKADGSTQMSIFARYVNPNENAPRYAADLLAAFNDAACQ